MFKMTDVLEDIEVLKQIKFHLNNLEYDLAMAKLQVALEKKLQEHNKYERVSSVQRNLCWDFQNMNKWLIEKN